MSTTTSEFFGHIIGGKEVPSLDGARFDTVNPWTRETWAEVALGSKADADAAITAAWASHSTSATTTSRGPR